MAEVHVIARAEAREGKAAEVKALLSGLVKPTRTENGCRSYEFFESNIPGVFYFNELWASQADLNAHAAGSHFQEVIHNTEKLLGKPMEVNLVKAVE